MNFPRLQQPVCMAVLGVAIFIAGHHKHPVFAATGLDYEALSNKMRRLVEHVESKVLRQMINYFAPQIPLADAQLLRQYYDTAKASPLTSTKANLKTEAKLVFNGAVAGGSPSRCVNSYMFLMCAPNI